MKLTNIAPHLHDERPDLDTSSCALRPVLRSHRNLVIAALDRLARIERWSRLAWALLLAMLCIGWLTDGPSMDRGSTLVSVAAKPSVAASIATPAPSSPLDRVASGLLESIEVYDAQDDPAASFAHAPDHPSRGKQFETSPAIAFTSAPPSRSERPPIRSFLQS